MTCSNTAASDRSAPFYWFLIFAAFFSLQVLPRLSQDSPAGDENVDIVDGFYYWQGDVISSAEHPPLAKALQALPSRAMGLQSKLGLNFTAYEVRDAYFLMVLNRRHFEAILKSARFVTYLFGLALGLVLFTWARQESIFFILTVLTLWAFEPIILAYSGFALAEIPLTFFFFTALVQHQKSIQKPSTLRAVMVGILSGMAVTVKFTAFLLAPVFLILEISVWLENSAGRSFVAVAQRWLWGGIAALLWVCLIYLPGTLAIPGHPWPWSLWMNGLHDLSNCFSFNSFYFRGILSHETHWDYYPTAFLLKSPLTFLILSIMGLFLVLLGKIKWPVWQWVPPVVFFAAFLFNYDLGLRMILPVYPFFILMAGRTGEWIANQNGEKNRVFILLWVGLLLFQVFSVGLRYPAYLSYFNEMVSQDKRIYWLGGPNLDIGQDTKRLALAARAHGWSHIKLAYAGSANPKIYGMDWSYWTQKDIQGPQPGWVYVINDDYLQVAPANSQVAALIGKSWITKRIPTGRIGDTWYYFEIPGKVLPDASTNVLSTNVFLDEIFADKIK